MISQHVTLNDWPKGNSEFCLLEILNVPRGEARPAIKSFVMPPNSKIEKKL